MTASRQPYAPGGAAVIVQGWIRKSLMLPVWAWLGTVSGGCAEFPTTVDGFTDFLAVNETPTNGELVITFFEVAVGDAMLVESPTGTTILIDGGMGFYPTIIPNYLEARGIRHLDAVILTHADPDHYRGMREILTRCPPRRFFHNGVPDTRDEYESLMEFIEEMQIPTRVLRRGDRLDPYFGGGIKVEVLYPDSNALSRSKDHNGRSIVLRVTHGQVVYLLSGDAEEYDEYRLLQLEGDALAADLLKLGHHAAIRSGTTPYIERVSPKIAIAQGTKHGNYDPFSPRPNYRIRRTLKRLNIPLLLGRNEGTIQVVSDGKTMRWWSMARSTKAIEKLREERTEPS
ncbi:MAG: ComEC/Rec2 family competence protein [Planctomycetota bacterium]|jgi:beta-lactamase superfamily II metal-dependent hydrolase